MNKKKIIMLFLFAGCIWIGGCKDDKNPLDSTNIESGDDKNPFNPPIFEIEDTTFIEIEDSTFIAFKYLKVEDAQRLIQGKWNVIKKCGGLMGKCYDLTDVYHEYIGIDKFRETNGNSISENKIVEWKKTKHGCRVLFEKEQNTVFYFDYLYFDYLINDTLTFGNINLDGMGGVAVRVK